MARQTQMVISNICDHLQKSGKYLIILSLISNKTKNSGLPALRTVACVGGTAMKDQLETIKKYKEKNLI